MSASPSSLPSPDIFFDGGPAFPTTVSENAGTIIFSNGMSLRDYFAAAALTGIVSACDRQGRCTWTNPAAASLSFALADEMLEARRHKHGVVAQPVEAVPA